MEDTLFDPFLTYLQNPTPFLRTPNRGTAANGAEKIQAQIEHLATFVRDNRDYLAPALIVGDMNVDSFDDDGYEDLLTRLGRPVDILAGGSSDVWEDTAEEFAQRG